MNPEPTPSDPGRDEKSVRRSADPGDPGPSQLGVAPSQASGQADSGGPWDVSGCPVDAAAGWRLVSSGQADDAAEWEAELACRAAEEEPPDSWLYPDPEDLLRPG